MSADAASREIKTVGHPVRIRHLHVLRTELLAPRLKGITLGGEELRGFTSLSPDDHVKVFFPAEGEVEVNVPIVGPGGLQIPEGKNPPRMRDYTPFRYDADKNELTLIFVLHGEGPGSDWAEQAQPGSTLIIGGPRGSRIVPESFDWYLMIGDETAIPAYQRRLREFSKEARGLLFLEVDAADSRPSLSVPAGFEVFWIPRRSSTAGDPGPLLRKLTETEFISGDYFAWVIGESSAVKTWADFLLGERRARKEWMKATSYWTRSY